ncbi:MAG: ABC transporter ATP-binding protein [Candidatus Delongbacteria bacterium]
MKDCLLELNNISAGYGRSVVVHDVYLKVYEKDFLGVIGPNGGGKSTIMKVILGIIKPVNGKIVFNRKLKFGYLPQFNLNDAKFPISVKDVVLSGLISEKKMFRGFSKDQIRRAENIIDKFGISEYRNSPYGELSGGQIQRVLLSRAIVSDPDILILDEPTAFTDEEFSNDLYTLLSEINQEKAIIMVSHDTGVISSYVKNIACVNGTLHYHSGSNISADMLDKYSCPVELIAHGPVPHRVLRDHKEKE